MNNFKIVMLGDMSVGKSSIIMRYVQGTFSETMTTTVGASHQQKAVSVKDQLVNLQIWDTAGQERYSNLAAMYYRQAHAVMLVWDATKPDTLNRAGAWIELMKVEIDISKIVLVLLGNKMDVIRNLGDTEFRQEGFLNKYKVDKVFQVSAKTGQNIDQAFAYVAQVLYEKRLQEQLNDAPTLINQNQTSKKGGCC